MIKLDTLLRFPGEETIEREVWFLLNTSSKTWNRRDELKKELRKRNQNLKIQKIFNISILWGKKKNEREDFAGGQVVKNLHNKKKKKNLPSNTGNTDSIPGRGIKIPQAAGQLNPCTTAKEPIHGNEQRP